MMKTLAYLILALFVVPPGENGVDVGEYAENFNLKNVDGNMVSLDDYPDAKGFIITFTCNTCPFSQMYEQRLIDLHKIYAPKGFPVIAINPNDPEKQPGDSFKEMKKRAVEKNFPFAYLVDETQEVTKAYGATNTPHMYILKKEDDKYRVMYIGAVDNNPKNPEKADQKYVREAVDALLKGKPVPEKKTKAIGCTIKWKSA